MKPRDQYVQIPTYDMPESNENYNLTENFGIERNIEGKCAATVMVWGAFADLQKKVNDNRSAANS